MRLVEITASGNAAWHHETQPEISGVLKEIQEDVGPNNSRIYVLGTPEGDVSIWSTTVLDSKLKDIPVGTFIQIEYLGQKTNEKNGRTFKDFRIHKGIAE